MSLITERPQVASWGEPDGIAPRGTLIVIPGRGERPELYERFGRRIAADGYRVHVEEVLYGLAGRIDAGDERALPRAAIAKLLITRSATSAVQTALTALGNPALTRSNPLERHFRDFQCCRIHPPQDDAALIAVGRRTLAVPTP